MLFNEGCTARIKTHMWWPAIKNSLTNWTAITDGTITSESVSLKLVLLNFNCYNVSFVLAQICDFYHERSFCEEFKCLFPLLRALCFRAESILLMD